MKHLQELKWVERKLISFVQKNAGGICRYDNDAFLNKPEFYNYHNETTILEVRKFEGAVFRAIFRDIAELKLIPSAQYISMEQFTLGKWFKEGLENCIDNRHHFEWSRLGSTISQNLRQPLIGLQILLDILEDCSRALRNYGWVEVKGRFLKLFNDDMMDEIILNYPKDCALSHNRSSMQLANSFLIQSFESAVFLSFARDMSQCQGGGIFC